LDPQSLAFQVRRSTETPLRRDANTPAVANDIIPLSKSFSQITLMATEQMLCLNRNAVRRTPQQLASKARKQSGRSIALPKSGEPSSFVSRDDQAGGSSTATFQQKPGCGSKLFSAVDHQNFAFERTCGDLADQSNIGPPDPYRRTAEPDSKTRSGQLNRYIFKQGCLAAAELPYDRPSIIHSLKPRQEFAPCRSLQPVPQLFNSLATKWIVSCAHG
jgi:hypothetical protein